MIQHMQRIFYGELAPWWPLISPPEDYANEAIEIARVLDTAGIPVRKVLELGSGGGCNASHLKRQFTMTLTDLSSEMLAVSSRLNPECEHHQGDMRSLRLDRPFDAVFIHDAVDYMTTKRDLRQALTTAFEHCRPGGIAVLLPDCTRETFDPDTNHGGTDASDGRGVRYLEWSSDPDPHDTWALTEYTFVLREPGGSVRAVHETHRFGLFSRDDWLRVLADTGFKARTVDERTTEDRVPRTFFVGVRPAT
jgi:SAM-dependent methyltransferase